MSIVVARLLRSLLAVAMQLTTSVSTTTKYQRRQRDDVAITPPAQPLQQTTKIWRAVNFCQLLLLNVNHNVYCNYEYTARRREPWQSMAIYHLNSDLARDTQQETLQSNIAASITVTATRPVDRRRLNNVVGGQHWQWHLTTPLPLPRRAASAAPLPLRGLQRQLLLRPPGVALSRNRN